MPSGEIPVHHTRMLSRSVPKGPFGQLRWTVELLVCSMRILFGPVKQHLSLSSGQFMTGRTDRLAKDVLGEKFLLF